MRTADDFSWKNAVAIRSAVSMPSRVIMSSANAKTPQNARAGRPRPALASMRLSMSDFIRPETRFM